MAQQNSQNRERGRLRLEASPLGQNGVFMHLKEDEGYIYHLKESTQKSKISKERSRSTSSLIRGHMADLNWSLQKAWHASLGDTWHTPHATRVPRSRKRKS